MIRNKMFFGVVIFVGIAGRAKGNLSTIEWKETPSWLTWNVPSWIGKLLTQYRECENMEAQTWRFRLTTTTTTWRNQHSIHSFGSYRRNSVGYEQAMFIFVHLVLINVDLPALRRIGMHSRSTAKTQRSRTSYEWKRDGCISQPKAAE